MRATFRKHNQVQGIGSMGQIQLPVHTHSRHQWQIPALHLAKLQKTALGFKEPGPAMRYQYEIMKLSAFWPKEQNRFLPCISSFYSSGAWPHIAIRPPPQAPGKHLACRGYFQIFSPHTPCTAEITGDCYTPAPCI